MTSLIDAGTAELHCKASQPLHMHASHDSGVDLLLTGSFTELGSLKYLDTPVIVILGRALAACLPVLLMLERWPSIVQVPWSAGHILRNMRVDLLALLIDLCRGDTGFSSFFKLLLPPIVFMILEERVCGSHNGANLTQKSSRASSGCSCKPAAARQSSNGCLREPHDASRNVRDHATTPSWCTRSACVRLKPTTNQ